MAATTCERSVAFSPSPKCRKRRSIINPSRKKPIVSAVPKRDALGDATAIAREAGNIRLGNRYCLQGRETFE